jgi:16S rRNA G527 N7-methylase RsmG
MQSVALSGMRHELLLQGTGAGLPGVVLAVPVLLEGK